MKKFFLILALIASALGVSAQHGTFYDQRATLFEVLPMDSTNIVFLGNSITNGCEWHELFNNPRIVNRGISGDIAMGIVDRLDPLIKGKPAKVEQQEESKPENTQAPEVPELIAPVQTEEISPLQTQTAEQTEEVEIEVEEIEVEVDEDENKEG